MPSTYAEHQAVSSSEKLSLVIIEASMRLLGWTLYSGSIYRIAFSYPVITSIEEDGVALTAVSDVGSVTAGKYYLDRANGYLYLRASDSTTPNGKFEACVVKLFFSQNIPVRAANDLASGFDVEWLPLVKNTSEYGVELDSYNQFGLAIEGAGSVNLYNDQSYWGSRFDKLTFENQRVYVYSWSRTLPIAQAKLIYRGKINKKSWSLEAVTFTMKDTLNQIRSPIALTPLSSLSGARLPDSLSQCFQRLIYGRVFGIKLINYDHVLTGYPLTGTISFSNGSANVTGSSTLFLKELSPNDQIFVGTGTKYTVKSVTDNTNLVLTQSYASVSASGQSGLVKPSHPKRYANREFSIAGHALRQPTTTVSNATNATQFECADLTDFRADDPVTIGSESGTVLRVSGNTLVLTGPLNAIPAVGATVTRPAISNVHLRDRLLTRTTDYTYDETAGTLTLDELAEFNVAPILSLNTGTLAFTNTSRTVTGTSTTLKKDVKPGDWVRRNGQTSWFEVLSVDSDTQLTLRTAATYTSSGAADVKQPDVYEEGKTVLSCDALGYTSDGTSDGTLYETCGSIAKDILIRAGLEDFLSLSTFTTADSENEAKLGIIIPETYNSKKAPSHRDVLNLVNRSVFGSLVQNEDFQLEYIILSPRRSESSTTVLKKADVLRFSVETTSDKIAKTVKVNYKSKEYDYTSDNSSNSQSEATSEWGNYLAKTENEFVIETNLIDENSADIYAGRWAFILGAGTSVLKIESKLQLSRLQVTDQVELDHDKLYERFGSSDKRRIGAIKSLKQSAFDVFVELEDLGNAFSRCATITEDTAVEYDSSTEQERAYWGHITDTYGMQDNDSETAGKNVIW